MLERAPAFGESQTTSADTLVFRRRNVITDTRPALRPLVKAIPWATLVLVLAIPVVVLLTVAQRHPDGWPAAWPALLDIWRKEPLRWLGMAGQLLLMPVIVWVVLSGGWGGRLVLDRKRLRYQSSLPILSRWLDWQLDLDGVRAGRVQLHWVGAPFGADPLRTYRLSWGSSGLRALLAASWILTDEPLPPARKPHRTLGLVRWQLPQNRQVLNDNLRALPLSQALAARGVVLPEVTGGRQVGGLDLLSYPRLRLAIAGFFSLVALAAWLAYFTRYQHFFVAPSERDYVVLGVVTALLAALWLWPELPRETEARASPGEFPLAKGVVSVLLGVAAALAGPQLGLAWVSWRVPAQTVSFEALAEKPPRLRALDGAGALPDNHPTAIPEFWASLQHAGPIELSVRRGVGGWWWQYDAEPLADRVDEFYAATRAGKATP